jgi:hypothetical protein
MSNPSIRVCRKLRTKRAFGSFIAGIDDWRDGEASTDAYWCLKTMESFGEDQQPAHLEGCREGEGRACFEGCEEDIA